MNRFLEEDVDFKTVQLEEYPELAAIEILQDPYEHVIVVFDEIKIVQEENVDDMLQFKYILHAGSKELIGDLEFKDYVSDCLTMSICNHLGDV